MPSDDASASIISESSLAIIRATAPAVKENAVAITSTFYPKLLGRHPELFQYFNESNQRAGGMLSGEASGETSCIRDKGGSDQARSLADAVVAYALNIEHLERLSEAVARICAKHCALEIKPEHYQLVHDNLMEAIGEVLGGAATPEVAAAWSEAVLALANIFVGVEQNLYDGAAKNQWAGKRDFRVSEIIEESPTVRSVRMVPSDGKGTCPYTAGQYISLYEKPVGKEYFAPRHYTLTSQPGDPYYQISVKRLTHPSGDSSKDGVMSGLVHHLQEGDTVHLGPAFGPNQLENCGDNAETKPAVFVSVGVGITYAVATLPAAIASRGAGNIAVFHGDRDVESHPFRKHIEDVLLEGETKEDETPPLLDYSYAHPVNGDAASKHCSEGRLTGEKIVETLRSRGMDPTADDGKNVDFFVCCGQSTGPIVQKMVDMGVDGGNIHLEYFGPFASVL